MAIIEPRKDQKEFSDWLIASNIISLLTHQGFYLHARMQQYTSHRRKFNSLTLHSRMNNQAQDWPALGPQVTTDIILS